ncbi:MAG: hypothetical protein L6R41_006603 [Letrouitia leprolyta]|nr:MAG: hypothetical protein L6R41_006603 [Letrouitia leprolyta]
MSSLYNLEPQPTAKVLLETTSGDISLELFAKQTPLASRNFLQLCLDGYYDNTIFHRLVPGFVIQGGDPTGTGEGGEAFYEGGLFDDEFHSRLKFNRRGLLGMANTGRKNDNGSQFFLTLGPTPELEGRNTMFGRVVGDTIYNLMKMGEAELIAEGNERPLYPTRIIGAEILVNPFSDMAKRDLVQTKRSADKPPEKEAKKKSKKKGGKTLLSFEEDEAGDGEGALPRKEKFNPKLVSAGPKSHAAAEDGTKAKQSPKTNSSDISGMPKTTPNDPEEKHNSKPIRRRLQTSSSPPPPDPNTQLPLPNPQSPRSSSSSSPPPSTSIPKPSSLLDRTNAQIASLKASMRRNIPSTTLKEPRKQSALEAMIPETATRGRKRKHGAANGDMLKDTRSMDILRAFREKLEGAAPAENLVPAAEIANDTAPNTVNGATSNAGGEDQEEEEEEATLCDLHFIAHCQSCQSWDKHLSTTTNIDTNDDDNDKAWMSHALDFDKDRLGKDLSWRKKNEDDLVVIDPREKARDLKEEQRGKRVKGAGRAWDRDRERDRGKAGNGRGG